MTASKTFLATALFLAFANPLHAEEPRTPVAPESNHETLHYEVPGVVPLLSPDYGLAPRVDILMTDDRLTPRRVQVRAGETVVWNSMARQASRIVFEREVARSMVCHSLVNFEIEGDRLHSAPIHAGEETSFCRLAPGTYRYRVVRDGPAERPSLGGHQLSSRLEGVIVVLPATAGIAGEMAAR